MFESIGRSFALVKTSWDILMQDKKLLAFPILSGIISIIVLLTFILPLIMGSFIQAAVPMGSIVFYAILFAFYAASYFVVIFFNTALISCVNARLNGKEMSVTEGLQTAVRHFPSILAWALVSATIGLILYLIEERFGWVGQLVASLLGAAWGFVTFFVVPVLVLEDKGVVDSMKESVALIKKTWGESIVGSASMAIVFVIIGVIAAILVFATLFIGNAALFTVALALFIMFVIILAIVYAAMEGIFVTALYTYAKTGTVPSAFNKDLIQNAFVQK
jgi:hypothetical protein